MLMDQRLKGSLLVMVSAASYGFMGVFARLAYGSGVGVLELLLLSLMLSFASIGAMLRAVGKIPRPTSGQCLSLFFLGGIAYVLQSCLLFLALQYIPISITVLVFYTYPALVTAASLVMRWEHITKVTLLSLVLAFIGLLLVVNPAYDLSIMGVGIAFGSAVAYAAYVIGCSRLLKGMAGDAASFYIIGFAAAMTSAYALAFGGINFDWQIDGWLWIVLTATISTSLSIISFIKGLRIIGPTRSSILSVLEIITSVSAAAVIFGERMTSLQALGVSLLLISIILVSLRWR